jgi:hypothetical protein
MQATVTIYGTGTAGDKVQNLKPDPGSTPWYFKTGTAWIAGS